MYSQIHEYSEALLGSIPLNQDLTKSSAVKAVPSDHLASSLMLNVYVRPSEDTSHDSAIPG